jgi:hypothetical protein
MTPASNDTHRFQQGKITNFSGYRKKWSPLSWCFSTTYRMHSLMTVTKNHTRHSLSTSSIMKLYKLLKLSVGASRRKPLLA